MREVHNLDNIIRNQFANVVANMMLYIIEDFGKIIALYDFKNDISNKLIPPILSHKIILLISQEMLLLIIMQIESLKVFFQWTKEKINLIFYATK